MGSVEVAAQSTNDYSFSQFVGTYTPITGGATTTTGQVDNNILKVAIPGGFNYLGILHDSVTISNNGHISFANLANQNSVATATYGIISASLTNSGGAIAAFAADLQGHTTGEVRYESLANEFVVQWSNYRRFANTGDTLNFQIRLEQSTGIIRIVYGNMKNSGTSTSYQPQVGLRGISNTDFNNRKVVIANGAWVNSTQGTLNSDNCYYSGVNQNVKPENGTTFVYTPSDCMSRAINNISNITANTATISWTSNANDLSYEYYYSTSNTAPTNTTVGTSVATNSVNLTGLQPSTTYYVWLRVTCVSNTVTNWGIVSSFNTPCVSINTLPWLENFDAVSGANGTFTAGRIPNCWSSIDATGVLSSASTYVTARSGNNVLAYRYGPNSTTGAWAVTPGFELQAGVAYRYKFYYKNYNSTAFQSLTVKIGDSQNTTLMTRTLGAPILNITNTTYREFYIDFTVPTTGIYYIGMQVFANSSPWYLNIDDVSLDYSPSCIEPMDITLSNLTGTSVDLSWTNLSATTSVEYYYSTSPTAPTANTAGVILPPNTSTTTINNLQPSSTYYLWVRNICSSTDISSWSLQYQFVTPCLSITTLPWLENFDAMTGVNGTFTSGRLPNCWASVDVAGVMSSASSYIDPRSGSNVLAYRFGPNSTTGAWAITPGFELQPNTYYRFKFYYKNYNTSAYQTLNVKIGTVQNANSLTTLIGTPITNIVNTSYKEYVVDFTVPTAGTYYIGMQVFANSSPWYLNIDDVSLNYSPPCGDPSNITTSNISVSGATINWNHPIQGAPDHYEYYVSTSPTGPTASSVLETTTGTSINLTNLQSSTMYYVWLRSVCSPTEKGEWKEVPSIYTGPCIPTVSYGSYYLNRITTTGAESNLNYTATSFNAFVATNSTLLVRQDQIINYSLSATPYEHYYFIWVDWNNDLDFNDPGELVLEYTDDYLTTYNGTWHIPNNAPVGRYSMRVANSYIYDDILACGGDDYVSYVDFTLEIKDKCPPTTVSIQHENACGNSLGSAQIDVVSTSTNISYTWSTGETTASISDLPMGNYAVTIVTDPTYAVCTIVDSFIVNRTVIATALRQLAPDCGMGNGQADVIAVGSNLSYLWSTGDTSTIIDNLSAGLYTLTVTDGICSKVSTVEVQYVAGFSVDANITHENMNLANSGAIELLNTPANATYLWSNGATTASIDGLSAGLYTVVITDADGCILEETFEIIRDTRSSVMDVMLGEIKLYPNPTTSNIHLAGVPADSKVILVNNLGQVIMQFVAQNEIENMDLSQLAPSTYWIRIENEASSVVLPVVRIQ